MKRVIRMMCLAAVSMPMAFAQEPPATEPAAAEASALPSAEEVLGTLNETLNFETRSARFTMTVVNPRRTKEYVIQSFGRGLDEAAMEYLEPARERGTRYLRRGDELWMYLPGIERTQKISGHMLRQGMGGSDMSYEDMTANTDWREDYTGTVLGIESVDGRPHYKVELNAKNEDVTYAKRVIWVDVENRVPTRQELYALSGLLVKRWQMTDVRQLEDGRYYPFSMTIQDTLREGTSTTITTTALDLDVALEDEVFSMRWLERR